MCRAVCIGNWSIGTNLVRDDFFLFFQANFRFNIHQSIGSTTKNTRLLQQTLILWRFSLFFSHLNNDENGTALAKYWKIAHWPMKNVWTLLKINWKKPVSLLKKPTKNTMRCFYMSLDNISSEPIASFIFIAACPTWKRKINDKLQRWNTFMQK